MAPPTDPGKKDDEVLDDPEHPDDEIEVEPDDEPDDEAEGEDSGKAVEAALAELKGITNRYEKAEKQRAASDARARQESAAAESAKPVELPDDIKELLASDDPAEARMGRSEKRRWEHEQKVDQRLAAMEQRVEETALAATRQEVEPEIRAGVTKYGLSPEEEYEVLEYITDDRHSERRDLPFEAGIRMRYPGRNVASRTSAPDNGQPSAPRRQPGQVIAGTGTGGRAPAQWKPGKDTSIEEAVAAGIKSRFGGRR